MTSVNRVVSMALGLVLSLPGECSDGPMTWSAWTRAGDGGISCDLQMGSRHLRIHLDDPNVRVARPWIQHWIESSARSLTGIYGRFPVPEAEIRIHIDDQDGPHHGVTFAGKSTTIQLGRNTEPADLVEDWIMTHEMVHLAFPGLVEQHLWMEEGLATYLEPLARERIGAITSAEVWTGLLNGLPQGLPQPDDAGLDHTHTWGRTYWGGCLFWLVADIQIHKASANRQAIDDLLRALNASGLDGRTQMRMEDICSLADSTYNNHIFSDLERRMASRPITVDLDGLFRDLGVAVNHGVITFDDFAPSATVRTSLMSTLASIPRIPNSAP